MRRMLPINNLQAKLMLLFFAIGLVPFCAAGGLSIWRAEELILNMATNHIENMAEDKAALLERWISERMADLEVMAGSSTLKSMDWKKINAYLNLVRSKYKVYAEIEIKTLEGGTVCSTAGRESKFTGLQPVLRGSGRLNLSDICLSSDRRESYFLISAPLVDESGDVAGFVRAYVGTGAILSDILRATLGETSECYLVNREGTFLAHKEPERILNENIAQSESFKTIFGAQKRRIAYVDYRGVEVIGASRRVGGTDWALVVEQDRDEALRAVHELKRHFILIIATSGLGALFSAWLLSRYVATPIRKLSKAAESLARGEFETVHIEPGDRGDEIGLLYDAFGEMARQLQDRQQRLEERVVLREAELKETDERLKQTHEAAVRSQQLASLGQLAAGVAHEIRTPLTSLKMFLQSIENEMEISSEYEEDFQVAMNQVSRMEATINRFLDFARPQAPVFVQVDARELIEDTLLVVGLRARQQETLIKKSIEDSLPPFRGDRKQLEEAVMNLMVNGLEALGSGGELSITAGIDTASVEGRLREFIRIDVADTGPGIKDESIPNLFDPFFTTKATGTGLGLSIVYSTIKKHGGQVSVKSGPGRGATFSLFIPVQPEGKR